jgi:hypothetical protein
MAVYSGGRSRWRTSSRKAQAKLMRTYLKNRNTRPGTEAHIFNPIYSEMVITRMTI